MPVVQAAIAILGEIWITDTFNVFQLYAKFTNGCSYEGVFMCDEAHVTSIFSANTSILKILSRKTDKIGILEAI